MLILPIFSRITEYNIRYYGGDSYKNNNKYYNYCHKYNSINYFFNIFISLQTQYIYLPVNVPLILQCIHETQALYIEMNCPRDMTDNHD